MCIEIDPKKHPAKPQRGGIGDQCSSHSVWLDQRQHRKQWSVIEGWAPMTLVNEALPVCQQALRECRFHRWRGYQRNV